MYPVGSYCMDISRCTVNKTLNKYITFIATSFDILKIITVLKYLLQSIKKIQKCFFMKLRWSVYPFHVL